MPFNTSSSIDRFLKQLMHGSSVELPEIARSLSDAHIAERGSVLPRGTTTKPADRDRRVRDEAMERMLCLRESSSERVRQQISRVLAEFAGEDAIESLRNGFLQLDEDEETQLYYLTALARIGGPRAVECLKRATRNESVRISRAARWLLSELESGGTIDHAEGRRKGNRATVVDPEEVRDVEASGEYGADRY